MGNVRKENRSLIVVICLLLFSISFAIFSRCWNYGLIHLDDYEYILKHVQIVNFSWCSSLTWCFTDVSESIWMPLTWLSYALDHWLFGTWYGGFHLHSVCIHSLNAILVWCLLYLLLPRNGGRESAICCLIAALAWAIHPLRCESVVFLASRKDVLSFFWELLALVCWVRGTQCEEAKRRAAYTGLSVVFFVFGAMCKPSVMTFPLLCLILDVFVLRKVYLLRYVAPLVLMFGLAAFAAWQQSAGGAMVNGAGETIIQRLAVAVSAFGIYLRNTFMPLWLAPQCVKQWPSWPRFLVPGIILSLGWGGYLLWRLLSYWGKRTEIMDVKYIDDLPVLLKLRINADYVFAGMAWFAIAIAPMLGIMSFGYHAHADRFTYIPSFGLALLLAAVLKVLTLRHGATKTFVSAMLVIAAFALMSWHQTGFWRDDAALFSRTIEIDGNRNSTAHKILAMHYFEETHELEKARRHFEASMTFNRPGIYLVAMIYAQTLVELGHDDDAYAFLKQFEKDIVKQYGIEMGLEIIHGGARCGADQIALSFSYRLARVAVLLGKEQSLDEALRELDILRRQGADDRTDWQYLMWRYLKLSGDNEKANAMLKQLLDPSAQRGYSQFRYLRKRFP